MKYFAATALTGLIIAGALPSVSTAALAQVEPDNIYMSDSSRYVDPWRPAPTMPHAVASDVSGAVTSFSPAQLAYSSGSGGSAPPTRHAASIRPSVTGGTFAPPSVSDPRLTVPCMHGPGCRADGYPDARYFHAPYGGPTANGSY
jgi:hypothetical protein